MDIRTEAQGPVLEIAFDRPARRNAITAAMYEALTAAIARAEAERGLRVMLIHGTPEAFTAGNDIEDFMQRPPQGEDAPVFRFLRTMSQAKKPIVAAVNGPAIGIGTTLLLHCDLVYAAENARFQLPFVGLGLVPEFASSYLLPMVAGYHRAAELLLLGEPFDANKAYECGFVTRVLPAAETLGTARAAAARLAALPGPSVRASKALMKSPHAAAVAAQLQAESAQFRTMLAGADAREALAAFLEKRKPVFLQETADDR
jgi:enoyl-CoA hydratase/carnithine racemase